MIEARVHDQSVLDTAAGTDRGKHAKLRPEAGKNYPFKNCTLKRIVRNTMYNLGGGVRKKWNE
jgi:hypothetical protein